MPLLKILKILGLSKMDPFKAFSDATMTSINLWNFDQVEKAKLCQIW